MIAPSWRKKYASVTEKLLHHHSETAPATLYVSPLVLYLQLCFYSYAGHDNVSKRSTAVPMNYRFVIQAPIKDGAGRITPFWKTKAINLGSGQSPASYKNLVRMEWHLHYYEVTFSHTRIIVEDGAQLRHAGAVLPSRWCIYSVQVVLNWRNLYLLNNSLFSEKTEFKYLIRNRQIITMSLT